jgi:hypothetical protein
LSRATGEARPHRPAIISVPGVGRVERAPDLAHATFSVEATRPSAAEARATAAGIAEAVIAALHGAGVAAPDLQTASLDVAPAWEQQERGSSVRAGFTVSTRLLAVIRDPDGVGRIIDAGLDAGATGLDGVTFRLADPDGAAAEARGLAVIDARARAAVIALAAGRPLGRLVAVVEGEPAGRGPRPMARMMAMASDAGPETPVLPGRVEVLVSVVAEWELEGRAR